MNIYSNVVYLTNQIGERTTKESLRVIHRLLTRGFEESSNLQEAKLFDWNGLLSALDYALSTIEENLND